MPEPLTIWCNALFPDDANEMLKVGVGSHRLIFSSERATNLGSSKGDPGMADADILFGQPDPDQVMELRNLKWVQITSAGYTRYDRPELWHALRERQVVFTNSSSVFDEPCAQHVLASMLSFARALPQSLVAQSKKEWAHEQLRPETRLLCGNVLLVGYGAIARRLVQLLAPFDVSLKAVRRHVRGDEGVETHRVEELPQLIGWADHIVNILPSSASTDGLFNSTLLAVVKPSAIIYNIGRGTTVDQAALVDALIDERLAGAYLDVTDPEPLPPDTPLWNAPNCWITPHTGGGHIEEFSNLVQHFLGNLQRFEERQELSDRVSG